MAPYLTADTIATRLPSGINLTPVVLSKLTFIIRHISPATLILSLQHAYTGALFRLAVTLSVSQPAMVGVFCVGVGEGRSREDGAHASREGAAELISVE